MINAAWDPAGKVVGKPVWQLLADMSPQQIVDLVARAEAMHTLTDPERLVTRDLEFHAAIVAAAGNATLDSLAATVAGRTARVRIWRAVVEHDVLAWTHDQHTAILQALCDRDSLAAWTAATTHVTEVEHWVRAQLDFTPRE